MQLLQAKQFTMAGEHTVSMRGLCTNQSYTVHIVVGSPCTLGLVIGIVSGHWHRWGHHLRGFLQSPLPSLPHHAQ